MIQAGQELQVLCGRNGRLPRLSRTKTIALHVLSTCCAFAAVNDDTSTPETAAINNIAAHTPMHLACADEARLLVVVDLCSRCKASLMVIT